MKTGARAPIIAIAIIWAAVTLGVSSTLEGSDLVRPVKLLPY